MYTLSIASTIKKWSVNLVREFIFENYYKPIGFGKKRSYYSIKHLKKKKRFTVSCKQIKRKDTYHYNFKEHFQSFIRRKNTKPVKQ